MIDYENAVRQFNSFLQNYDVKDGKIALKVRHTYKVADLSETIARSLSLPEEEVQLARLIGLLHDIGRFEQVKRYDTFLDAKSVNHAHLGVEILEKDDFIGKFCAPEYRNVVLKAVENHNRYQIEDGLDERTLIQCRIIRDADKTDIFRVRVEDPLSDAIPFSLESLENGVISDEVYDDFMQEKEITRQERKTPLDVWIMGLAFIYDYNYPKGLEILEENHYIDLQINRLHYTNQKTAEQMVAVRQQAHAYIRRRLQAWK